MKQTESTTFEDIQYDIDFYGEAAQSIFNCAATVYAQIIFNEKNGKSNDYSFGKFNAFFNSLSMILGYQNYKTWNFVRHYYTLEEYIKHEAYKIYREAVEAFKDSDSNK